VGGALPPSEGEGGAMDRLTTAFSTACDRRRAGGADGGDLPGALRAALPRGGRGGARAPPGYP
jgi:hypothetical protein